MRYVSESIGERVIWLLAHARFPPGWGQRRAVAVMALILAVAALWASALPGQASSQMAHAIRAHTSGAARVLIGRADLHIDDLPGDSELEVDLSISQTQRDCQIALRGQLCLRYNILIDDKPVQAGYGLISLTDVTVTTSAITLTTDTRHDPHLIRSAGAGGVITVTWRSSSASSLPHPATNTVALTDATVEGSIVGYTIPDTHVTAGVLVYGSV